MERALMRDAARCGVAAVMTGAAVRPWASATFSGAIHALTIAIGAGDAADRWLAELPERELAMDGHLVVDVLVAARRETEAGFEADIEVLSVEER